MTDQQIPKYQFNVGDVVRVTMRDIAETKLHPVPFEGIVIAKRGNSVNKTFTIRKQATGGIAIERIFPLDLPAITDIKVIKTGSVRRAKLYYLRKKK